MRVFWIIIVVYLALGVGIGVARQMRGQQPPAAHILPITPETIAVRIMFGFKDMAPTQWDGSVTVVPGAVVRLEGWRFRQQDAVLGTTSWRAMTQVRGAGRGGRSRPAGAGRRAQPQSAPDVERAQVTDAHEEAEVADPGGGRAGAPGRARLRQPVPNSGTGVASASAGAVIPNGVIVVMNATPRSEARVTTKQGEFRFNPWRLAQGQRRSFLGGAATVERVVAFAPVPQQPTENDFPAAAAGADGAIWVSYVAYQYGRPLNPQLPTYMPQEPANFNDYRPTGNGDQVRLARLTSKAGDAVWSDVTALTELGQDVIRPAVAVTGDGSVWVVWSQNVAGNWDLYARRFRNGNLSNTFRVTADPGPDLDPALATDRQGNLWLAWHGFRGDNFDIFLASLPSDSTQLSSPVRVSTSPRNEWNAQVACDQEDAVYVVWDTYDQGSYDVVLRRMSGGRLEAPVAVAETARFEARPSLVCDSSNRVWVAWEEAPERWGKDYGYLVQDQGVTLYTGHTVAVRVLVNGQFYQTAGPLSAVLPQAAGRQQSFPRLALDAGGRVCLSFRVPLAELTSVDGTAWFSFVTFYEGNAWSPLAVVPDTDALMDNRPALVTPGTNSPLYMISSSDGRNHASGERAQDQLYVQAISTSQNPGEAPSLVAATPPPAPGPGPDVLAERADIGRMRDFRSSVGGKSYQLLRGDFHRHTEISFDGGGDGSLIDMFRYAIDAAGQDWICAGDHDNGSGREYTWWQIQKLDDALHMGPSFVPLFGYERSLNYPNGHRNVMFAQRGVRPLPRLGAPNNVSTGDTKMLYRYLAQFDGICASHTSATDQGTDWRDNDAKYEPFVEIYQGDRQSYEYAGAPKSGSQTNSPAGYQPAGFIWNALDKGYRLGFQASSDHRSTHISYAIAYAEQPTREAIFDAFSKRHCYGATDNIVLEVRNGEHLMGDEFTTATPPKLEVHVIGTKPISQLVVVKDNQIVYTTAPNQMEVSLNWVDNQPRAGVSYYYVRVEQVDGQIAWASPMWMHYSGG